MKAGGDVNLVRSLCYDMGHVFKGNAELADALAEMKGMGRGEVGEYSFKKWWFKHADSYALPSQYARLPSLPLSLLSAWCRTSPSSVAPSFRTASVPPGWPSRPPHICVRAFRALSPALYRIACPVLAGTAPRSPWVSACSACSTTLSRACCRPVVSSE